MGSVTQDGDGSSSMHLYSPAATAQCQVCGGVQLWSPLCAAQEAVLTSEDGLTQVLYLMGCNRVWKEETRLAAPLPHAPASFYSFVGVSVMFTRRI